MSKATKKSILFALGVLALIAFAMWLRYASRHIFHSPVVSHLRSGIYVFLFSAWCYSLRIRIVQTQVRRYLLAISVLMVLWILLRSIKFSIENTDAERWLWYFYYFPMLFIPMLSVFVSRSLGKGEDFRLPRWTKLLYLPTLLLLLLVLTNDLHQQVFSFPSGVLSDQAYRYESGYFFVLGLGGPVRGVRVAFDGEKLPHPAQQENSLAAAGSACAFAGLCLCVCQKGPLGLGACGRYDGVAVPDLCEHP